MFHVELLNVTSLLGRGARPYPETRVAEVADRHVAEGEASSPSHRVQTGYLLCERSYVCIDPGDGTGSGLAYDSPNRRYSMRELFPGFYPPTPQDFDTLWTDSLVAFDANALLNIYRYPQASVDQFFLILETLGDRVWVPHQAAYEFSKNRMEVIAQQQQAYETIQRTLDGMVDNLEKQLRAYAKHVLIQSEELSELVERIRNEVKATKDAFRDKRKQHPNRFTADGVGEQIATLLSGKIGEPYTSTDLEGVYRRAESRFALLTPPGYEDAGSKNGANKYGDVVVWFQLLDKARASQRSVIFVTDDVKPDWWNKTKSDNTTSSPRSELIQEMYQEAGIAFYMYRADDFMREAMTRLGLPEREDAVEGVSAILQQDEADYEQAREDDTTAGTVVPALFLSPEASNTLFHSFISKSALTPELLSSFVQAAIPKPFLTPELLSSFVQAAMPKPFLTDLYSSLAQPTSSNTTDTMSKQQAKRRRTRKQPKTTNTADAPSDTDDLGASHNDASSSDQADIPGTDA